MKRAVKTLKVEDADALMIKVVEMNKRGDKKVVYGDVMEILGLVGQTGYARVFETFTHLGLALTRKVRQACQETAPEELRAAILSKLTAAEA